MSRRIDQQGTISRRAACALLAVCAVLCATPAATRDGFATTVVVDRATPDIFPDSWRVPAIDAQALPLPEEERPRARAIVDRALAKYPSALLDANLRTVYVLGRLRYDGVATGGTNSRRDVYVVARRTFAPSDVEKNLHAEFSSILLRRYPDALDRAAWRETYPSQFAYRGSGVQAVRNGEASTRATEGLLADGFLNEYAMASLEEDFNSYAGRLWLGDPAFWRAIDGHPKAAIKARLVIAFYAALDPTLTETFFRALVPDAAGDRR